MQMGLDFNLVADAQELVAGVDEVGRGPLCGAVVTAAVILDPQRPILGLNDSKKLTEARREKLYDEICEKALSWCIARAEIEEIDELNILHATMLAMQRAVEGLHIQPKLAMIDGNRCPKLAMPAEAVVKGDSKVPAIAAASILAKVSRDREMAAFELIYPGYGIGGLGAPRPDPDSPTFVRAGAAGLRGSRRAARALVQADVFAKARYNPGLVVSTLLAGSLCRLHSFTYACTLNTPWSTVWCGSSRWSRPWSA